MPTPGEWQVTETPHSEPGHPDVERYRVYAGKRPIIDGYVLTKEDADLIAAAGTAAHECAQMGYDPVEAVRVLPEMIRTLQEYAVLGSGRCKIGQPLADMNRTALARAAGKEGA
jgi:hypothetical protein